MIEIGLPLPVLLTRLRRALARFTRCLIVVLGGLALLMGILAFTPLPWRWHQALGTAAGVCVVDPATIVVLGGSGMPSGPELLRLHSAAQFAKAHPAAVVIVVHPPDTAAVDAMVAELLLRGVDEGRIERLMQGANTREQAMAVLHSFPASAAQPMALVTAPENAFRSVHAFRKAGGAQVCGVPAWDTPMFIDLDYDHRRIGGSAHVPDVSASNALRYDAWNRLKLQVGCLRESVAIAYYWLNGWI